MKKGIPEISSGLKHDAKALARFTAPMPSVEERKATGKALRAKVPHEQHAEYRPAPNRADPVAILQEQAKTRLLFLIPICYARMLASPFCVPVWFGGGYGRRSERDSRDGPDGPGLRG